MKVLILSCNTGGGHNSAGQAMKERLELDGHYVVMLDFLKLANELTAKVVGDAYVNIAKYTPNFFHFIYDVGMAISSSKRKSPVYFANSHMAKYLKNYLENNHFDIILMPHLYPAETITYMKKNNMPLPKTIAISTDYTCIPFWEETNCDAYVVAHEDLIGEYVKRGIPQNKIYPLGIPVKENFNHHNNTAMAKKKLHLPTNKPMHLIIGGSMGFGKIQNFTSGLNKECKSKEEIVVICGNNKKLKSMLDNEFRDNKNIKILGFTDKVNEYMSASDVIYTKPGGLTSTEVININKPLVHTNPIPGCETSNVNFFAKRKMSVSANSINEQIKKGRTLIYNKKLREKMICAQKKNVKANAAYDIERLMLKLCDSNTIKESN